MAAYFGIRLPVEQAEKLMALEPRLKVRRNNLIKQAIAEFLARHDIEKPQTSKS